MCLILVLGIAIGSSAASVVQTITAELRPDFEIVIDGETQNFKNASGEDVYPILYEGTTYLPIRAIGEMMGKTVYWYQDEKVIELKDTDTLVTDADVIITGGTTTTGGTTSGTTTTVTETASVAISLEEAKAIALDTFNLDAADVTFTKEKLKRDDGRYEYDFVMQTTDAIYSVEIDANTGAATETEIKNLTTGTSTAGEDIGAAAAKEITLAKAGFAETEVTRLEVERDRENGVIVYEVEFYNNGVEYSAVIRASDGAILEWETDIK